MVQRIDISALGGETNILVTFFFVSFSFPSLILYCAVISPKICLFVVVTLLLKGF